MADCFLNRYNSTSNQNVNLAMWEHSSGADGYLVDGDGYVGNITSEYIYIGINKPFKYTQSFEIVINFVINSLPTRSQVLFGSRVKSAQGFFKAPSFELEPNAIWAGLSYTGTKWDNNIMISDFEYEINKDYYLKYSHNVTSKILKLEISYDGVTWTTLSELTDVSIGYQGKSNEYLEIGGVAQSSAHYFSCGKINLFRSYILTDDELFWGIKYN